MTIADSSNKKKLSLHVSTFSMKLSNITQVAVFTELVRKKLLTSFQGNNIIDNIVNKRSFSLQIVGTPKFIKEIGEHVRLKKTILPKNGIVFDFMLRLSNDKSEVVKSPLLAVSEPKVKRYNDDTNSKTDQVEFNLVEELLRKASIEGFDLSFPSESSSNVFPLKRISPSYCSLCDQEYTNKNAYIIRYKKFYSFHCYHADQKKPLNEKKSSIKLTLNETALN
ncbi:hypothetical protein RclHR1_17190003 [Rhizophagus clarus]|uniref:Uncharacterized protein n=1 Tax=Rhizophagus clarus TaxID=94130 RepID=A0A2Z6QJJ8_9GLOM|nr:hypothetical protein RclHR1_17190003 [Rhizophagus clarus]GES96775.1 hypothetical protein RCL_jg14784.t1 [Rhizophagus clarus]